MDWSYVAGYFDGEGSVHCTPLKHAPHRRTQGLTWHNTHLSSLEAICDFMQAGRVRERKTRKSLGSRSMYVLLECGRADLIRILDCMIPHLLVKKAAALVLRNYLASTKSYEGWGKAAAISTAQFQGWYHDEGKSLTTIATIVGVTRGAVRNQFRRRNIPCRSAAEGSRLSDATVGRGRRCHSQLHHLPA